VDYFNKMAELIFVSVFYTHVCKKVNKMSVIKKPNYFRQANTKKCNCVRYIRVLLFYIYVHTF